MNKNPIAKGLTAALLVLATLPAGSHADSLLEIYQQAVQSDPLVHEAEARRLAALEAEPQARSLVLPQVGFGADYTKSDGSGSRVDFDPLTGLPSVNATESDSTAERWQFTLTQTLFRWDQIVGLRRADKVVAKAEADREAAQQDLILRVAQRYFDVLAAEDRLTAVHANRNAISRQLEQAKQRFDVGLIAITDVQESQARYDLAVADEIAAKRQLATAREFLREITGNYTDELDAPGDDLPLVSPDPADERSWIDLSMSQNLALVAARIDERLARDEISTRKSGHYPTVDLVATSGESDTETDFRDPNDPTGTIFNTDSINRGDSISVQLNVPLFAGGGTTSRVREAVYLHRASRENLRRVTRETERSARDAYLGVISEISRVQALGQAVQSNRTALEATQAGYEVGTRTIVEVLNAQFLLYQSITDYYQSRYDYLLNMLRLNQAAGSLQVQDLEALQPYLKPRKTPEQVFAEEAEAEAGTSE